MKSVDIRDSVLFDLTCFLRNPVRTGVQRYLYQLINNWPTERELIPVVLDDKTRLSVIDFEIFALIDYFFSCTSMFEEAWAKRKLQECSVRLIRQVENAELQDICSLFLPEPTFHMDQTRFYNQIIKQYPMKIVFMAYDFIPWHSPEYFPELDFANNYGMNEYLRALRRCPNIAFLSTPMRRIFETRILRGSIENSIILGGGADNNLVPQRQPSDDTRIRSVPEFIVIGTVQRRKQHFLVLDAFEKLWNNGAEVRLTFIGQCGDLDEEDHRRLGQILEQTDWFQWVVDATDRDLADVLVRATATIYVSAAEGLGLPVFESLRARVPVIVSRHIPALEFVPSLGCICVDASVDGVIDAVTSLLDAATAQRLRNEIKAEEIPVWSKVAETLASWLYRNAHEPSGGYPALLSRRVMLLARSLQAAFEMADVQFILSAFRSVFSYEPNGQLIAHWRNRWKLINEDKGRLISLMLDDESFMAESGPEKKKALAMAIILCEKYPYLKWGNSNSAYRRAAIHDRLGNVLERVNLLFNVESDMFVTFCYRVLLQREPDENGLNNFTARYESIIEPKSAGDLARSMIIRDFMSSEEFGTKNSVDVANDIGDCVLFIERFSLSEDNFVNLKLETNLIRRLGHLELIEDDYSFCYFARRFFGGQTFFSASLELPTNVLSRIDFLDSLLAGLDGHEKSDEIRRWRRQRLTTEPPRVGTPVSV